MVAYLNRCRSGNSVLKLEIRNSDRLHGLITLQHQFANLLQHLTFDAQQLAVPLVRLADAGLVSGLSFHCLKNKRNKDAVENRPVASQHRTTGKKTSGIDSCLPRKKHDDEQNMGQRRRSFVYNLHPYRRCTLHLC